MGSSVARVAGAKLESDPSLSRDRFLKGTEALLVIQTCHPAPNIPPPALQKPVTN